MSETLTIGDVEVVVRRSDRRRTIGLIIERDGSVVAATPLRADMADILRVVRSREVWIHSALIRRESAKPEGDAKEYVSGEGFYYLGRKYRLIVVRKTPGRPLSELRLFENRFQLRDDCVSCGRECFVRWYTEQAEYWLREKTQVLGRRLGVQVGITTIMDLGFRWASCSPGGRLNFHWRVIMLPQAMTSYLVLHELCHIIEHNHTQRFWALVRRVDHDFERKERWLRENGARYSL